MLRPRDGIWIPRGELARGTLPPFAAQLAVGPRHPSRYSQRRVTALRSPASRWWGGAVMAGPRDAVAEGRGRGGLRASDADREQVIGTLKTAFVQGRLTRDELG